jgi:hypothetical protein
MENIVVIEKQKLDQILADCESLKTIVKSVDHILGMDELEELNYFISCIEISVEEETNSLPL